MLAIFMAPITAGVKVNDKEDLDFGININKIKAEEKNELTKVLGTSYIGINPDTDKIYGTSATFSGKIILNCGMASDPGECNSTHEKGILNGRYKGYDEIYIYIIQKTQVKQFSLF